MTQFNQGGSGALNFGQDPVEDPQQQSVQNVDISQQPKEQPERQGMDWWDTTDVAAGIGRGVVGAGMGIYNTADWILGDTLPDWETNPFGESRSVAGALMTGLVEFGIGMIPGMAATRVVGAAAKLGKFGRASSALKWLAAPAKGEVAGFVRQAGRFAVGNAGAGFIFGTPGQERLSNLAVQFDSPILNNTITQYLAGDTDESTFDAKLKNALENAALGVAADALFAGIGKSIKAVRRGIVSGEQVIAAGGSVDDATRAAVEAEQKAFAEAAPDIKRAAEAVDAASPQFDNSQPELASRSGIGQATGQLAQHPDGGLAATLVSKTDNPTFDLGVSEAQIKTAASERVKEMASVRAPSEQQVEILRDAVGGWGEDRRRLALLRRGSDDYEAVLQDIGDRESLVHNTIKGFGVSSLLPESIRKQFWNALANAADGNGTVEEALAGLQKAIADDTSRFTELVKSPKTGTNDRGLLTELGFNNVIRANEIHAENRRYNYGGLTLGGTARESIQSSLSEMTGWNRKLGEWFIRHFGDQLDKVDVAISDAHVNQTGAHGKFGGGKITLYQGMESPAQISAVLLHEAVHGLVSQKIEEHVGRAIAKTAVKGTRGLQAAVAQGQEYIQTQGASLVKNNAEFRKLVGKIKDKPTKTLFEIYDQSMQAVKRAGRRDLLPTLWGPDKTGELQYGFANIQEFLAEAFTNKKFQEFLDGISISIPNEGPRSLWKRFVDSVSDLLGIRQLIQDARSGFEGITSADGSFGPSSATQSQMERMSRVPGIGVMGEKAVPTAASSDVSQQLHSSTALERLLREGAEVMAQPAPTSGINSRITTGLAEATSMGLIPGSRRALEQMADGPVLKSVPYSQVPESTLAGRQVGPAQGGVIDNQPRVGPVEQIRDQIADLIRKIRTSGMDSMSDAEKAEMSRLMDEATEASLKNFGFGVKNGSKSGEFMLTLVEAITQNKDLYETAVQVRSNAASAAARDEWISLMQKLGGLNEEQMARFAQTISDWHGPMFEDGALVVMGMLEKQVKMFQEAVISGASAGERDALLAAVTQLAYADRRIANTVGRMLQNRKMFWQEALAVKISNMSPAEVSRRVEALEDLVKIGVIDKETFFRVKNDGFINAGTAGIMTWLFKGSILSGPPTFAVNAGSGILANLYMPAERALGHLALSVVGKSTVSRAAQELSLYRDYARSMVDVFNAMTGMGPVSDYSASRAIRNSFRNEGDAVTLGSASSPYGEFVPRRPISADNPTLNRLGSKVGMPTYRFDPATNTNHRTVFGTALEWVGKTSGMPLRIMGTIDETLSSVYARAEARRIIMDAAPDHIKMDAKKLAQFTEDKMREAFDETGALFSEDSVRAKIMRQAKAEGYTPGTPEYAMYVQNNMAKQWTAPQGLDRENVIFLQNVSKKVRARTNYTTFKRDYQEIVEGNTFGPAAVGQLGQAASGLVRNLPAAGLIIPFVKTPTNLAAWALERMPTSAAVTLKRQLANPETAGEAMGRLCAGSLFWGTMITAAMSGAITGRGPSDPNVRKALQDSGWQPYSFKFGDTYVQYGRMDPFATIFGMAADLVEIAQAKYTDKEFLNTSDMVAKVAIGTISNNLVNKTYLAGLKGALDAIMSWETKGPRFLRQYVGSVVPNFLAQSSMVMDDDLAAPRSALDAIRARMPGFGDTVDRVRNVLGEPLENPSEAWNVVVPIKASKEKKDPVRQELAGLMVGFSPPDPQLDGGINLTDYKNAGGQSAYDRYQELTSKAQLGGQSLRDRLLQIIQSDVYKRMPASSVDGVQTTRVSLLRSEISRYRREALRQLEQEYPDLQRRRGNVSTIKQLMRQGM